MGLNYIILEGEVLEEPEKKHTSEGEAVVFFNMLVKTENEHYSSDKPSSIRVLAGKKLVNECLEHVKKKYIVLVEGKLYTKSVETRFAYKQYTPYIHATGIEVIKEISNLEENQEKNNNKQEEIEDENIPF